MFAWTGRSAPLPTEGGRGDAARIPAMSENDERFGRFPLRLSEGVKAGYLTFSEFSLLCWLESQANYRIDPPEVNYARLSVLAEECAWELTRDWLRKLLH